MSFVTLRDLNTDDTVLGADWQDIRENFEYLKSPASVLLLEAGPYVVSGDTFQWTDPDNLKFTLTTEGGPVVIFFGGYLSQWGTSGNGLVHVKVGTARPNVRAVATMDANNTRETFGFAFPWVLSPGDTEIGMEHLIWSGQFAINYAFVGAREF